MSEPDWKAAYQRAVQDATLALSGKAAAEARAYRLRLTDEEREAIGVALQSLQENYRGCNQQEIDTLRSLLRRVE